MDIACIVFGVIFIVFGLLVALGKIHIFLNAWKNTPQEQKEKIRIKELCRNIGEVIMLSGIIFLLNGFLPNVKKHVFVIAIIAWMVVALIDLIFIFKSKHYEKKNIKEEKK